VVPNNDYVFIPTETRYFKQIKKASGLLAFSWYFILFDTLCAFQTEFFLDQVIDLLVGEIFDGAIVALVFEKLADGRTICGFVEADNVVMFMLFGTIEKFPIAFTHVKTPVCLRSMSEHPQNR